MHLRSISVLLHIEQAADRKEEKKESAGPHNKHETKKSHAHFLYMHVDYLFCLRFCWQMCELTPERRKDAMHNIGLIDIWSLGVHKNQDIIRVFPFANKER